MSSGGVEGLQHGVTFLSLRGMLPVVCRWCSSLEKFQGAESTLNGVLRLVAGIDIGMNYVHALSSMSAL